MKKLMAVVATMILFSIFLTPVFANDTDDLQKLQPLSSLEQSMYGKIKDNATELHKFIVTRTYIRAIKENFKTDDTDSIFTEKAKDVEKVVKKYPVPDDFWPEYADTFLKGLTIFNAKLLQ
jgi:L-lysine 2,3-aminomutase